MWPGCSTLRWPWAVVQAPGTLPGWSQWVGRRPQVSTGHLLSCMLGNSPPSTKKRKNGGRTRMHAANCLGMTPQMSMWPCEVLWPGCSTLRWPWAVGQAPGTLAGWSQIVGRRPRVSTAPVRSPIRSATTFFGDPGLSSMPAPGANLRPFLPIIYAHN